MIKKENLVLALLIIVPIILLFIIYKNKGVSSDYDLKIYFFNAGKADAILISKDNRHIMIDTGEQSLSDDILRYFENNNITKLDYLIITHFDKDHVGSAANILNNIEVGEVIQSNSIKDSEYYTNYLNALFNKSITPVIVSNNYALSFANLDVVVNGPNKVYDTNESNNSSLIISLIYNNNKFLFMGDSENARIKDYISNNNVTYDFIKIPYHGNYLNKLNDLLSVVKPKYGVMTCSKNEGCEEETLKILNNYNIKYYMTKNGIIKVLSNGKNIIIKQ